MGYKSTLLYGTPILTQKQKHGLIQWPIQHKDDHCSRTTFTDENCFAIPFVNGHEIQVLKSNESPKTKRSLRYREASVSRASLFIIPLKQLRMAPTTFKII